ncbi:unnamed protein product [Linum trigynum]|uniref:Thaumatin-like protein n=1 Tax=Linum trigynum TaxID=586398 RepID=A0AAV2DNC0_9ROSI
MAASLIKPISLLLLLLALALVGHADAAKFDITNKCSDTVWAASVPVGGGRQLNSGETWTIDAPPGTSAARIWARTNCQFDGAGRGTCQTGDCGGVLDCKGYGVFDYPDLMMN